jgi:hypothetical protein
LSHYLPLGQPSLRFALFVDNPPAEILNSFFSLVGSGW